jgi:predicted phosphodiesterase
MGEQFKTVVVINDVHVPFHDERAVALVFAYIGTLQPDMIILNGDILDFYQVSDFAKDPDRTVRLVDELRTARELLERLRDLVPKAEIVYIEGNHEHRLHRFLIKQAPELKGLRGLSVSEQLDLDDLGIRYIECPADQFIDTYLELVPGRLLVGHFKALRGNAGATAHALLDQYAASIIDGHCHSAGFAHKTLAGGKVVGAWENGCLCDLDPHYMRQRKWLHAFAVAYIPTDAAESHLFHVSQKLVLGYAFWDGDRLWRG